MRRAKFAVLAPFIAIFLTVAPAAADSNAAAEGLGYFPSRLQVQNALRGQRYQTGTVLINQTSEARVFDFSTTGAIAEWVSFARKEAPEDVIDEATVPPHSELNVLVYFHIPEGTANGTYEGTNLFDSVTQGDIDKGTGTTLGFEQTVVITVSGDQILDVRIEDVYGRDVEIGQPLRVEMQLSNQGNVDIMPFVQLSVQRTDAPAAIPIPEGAIEQPIEPLHAGETSAREALWDTTGQAPGDYRATYAVLVQGKEQRSGEFDFRLLPAGALARSGIIKGVEFRDLVPGTIGQADVHFHNTGQGAAQAEFVGQIYRGDRIVAEVSSPAKVLARANQEVNIPAFFPVSADGEYVFRGRVFFEGAQTDEVTKPFRVGAATDDDSLIPMRGFVPLAAASFGILLVGGGAIFKLRRNGRKA